MENVSTRFLWAFILNNADVVRLEGEYLPLEYELPLIILKERFYSALLLLLQIYCYTCVSFFLCSLLVVSRCFHQ